ncbi:carboxypeptidase regulatory-like domain-containing protein [Hymenobacter mucosus]|uniref:Carboxypeptidase regulatory-like domain-containing protein n=1 Tax=Hymenobacter mucosus TaxID=1411120 RepID=A0A238VG63_9BACT|nr:carboxypeptidase regulatory-like domain-containing protein [Hymenobacter mucosus]SNR33380.1 Carboxypeptidase regulatory-like domain-containing protein [Hymenobacter mucosus]
MKTLRYLLALFLLLPLTLLAQTRAAKPTQLPPAAMATIAAQPATAAPKVAGSATPASHVISGIVLSTSGVPLAGATVELALERSHTSSTNADGMFMLRTTATAPTLIVSYAGYQQVQVTVDSGRPVSVEMQPIRNYAQQLKQQSKAANKAYRKR